MANQIQKVYVDAFKIGLAYRTKMLLPYRLPKRQNSLTNNPYFLRRMQAIIAKQRNAPLRNKTGCNRLIPSKNPKPIAANSVARLDLRMQLFHTAKTLGMKPQTNARMHRRFLRHV